MGVRIKNASPSCSQALSLEEASQNKTLDKSGAVNQNV
jgi:hypothetical protein